MRIAFAGTPEFSKNILVSLIDAKYNIVAVYTQPDRPKGRGKKLLPSAVKTLALENNIQVLQPQSLKNLEAKQQLQELNIDLLIVVAYGLILPQNILDIPKSGCINIHASLLPKWRGAAPIQRAILAGDTKTGITIMKMDAGLDTGDMLLTKQCDIKNTENSSDLELKLQSISSELILKFLSNPKYYLDNAIPQNNSVATYADKISKQEARINWQDSATNIARKIRAFNPIPGCYCFLNDNVTRIKIWEAVAIEAVCTAEPGTIITICPDDPYDMNITAGDGSVLKLLKIQLPGGKALSVKEILNAKAGLFPDGSMLV